MFSPQIKLKSLDLTCRSLATMLHSGVDVRKAFELAGGRTRDSRCRQAMLEISDAVGRGEDVSSAMRAQAGAFPDLMIDMVGMAEQTGSLPEVLEALGNHYENNLRLRMNFFSQIAWPVFQLVAAIFIIAVVILLMGWIAKSTGSRPFDPLGLGLVGTNGAVIWLTCTFGSVLGLFVLYQILAKTFQGKRSLDLLLMKIPVLGTCMQSFAIARFSWAFYLTQQAGMPIEQSLDASLRATANGAFLRASPLIRSMILSGESLSGTLATSGLFPADFVHMVDVAETSGTVPEALNRLSSQFEDQARRSLTALTAVLAWATWAVVATFIIFFIFRLALNYIGMINEAARGNFDQLN